MTLLSRYIHLVVTQRTNDGIIASFLRRNDAVASFRRNNVVITVVWPLDSNDVLSNFQFHLRK